MIISEYCPTGSTFAWQNRMVIILACPGQGSQTPGFLSPWLEIDGVRELLESYSDAAQVDLIKYGTTADADQIRDTQVAQPLIVAAGLVSLAVLDDFTGSSAQSFAGAAGHSVGEITALAASGVIDDFTAMSLVGLRGRAMAAAAAKIDTGMSAVLGGDQDEVVAYLNDLDLTAANYNGSGQIVAAGELSALAKLSENPPKGTRIIPLQVAGAFHTAFMADAVADLQSATSSLEANDPVITLWSNKDGSVVSDGKSALDFLVGQIASPVRWDLCMSSFQAAEVSGIVELAPGGTLVGLAKRAMRGTPTVAIKTPEDIEAAAKLLNEAK